MLSNMLRGVRLLPSRAARLPVPSQRDPSRGSVLLLTHGGQFGGKKPTLQTAPASGRAVSVAL